MNAEYVIKPTYEWQNIKAVKLAMITTSI